jgi:hypothetical protein
MSLLFDIAQKMARLQGHVRVHDCRGTHESRWREDLGYWDCAKCMTPLDEQRRGQWSTVRWLADDKETDHG